MSVGRGLPALARFWWAGAVLLAVLALGAWHGFALRWPDFGTADWIAYWSYPRGLLLGHGYSDQVWLTALQQSVGYFPRHSTLWPLHNPPPLVVLLIPMGALPFTAATLGWVALSALAFLWAARTLNRVLPAPLPEPVALALAVLALPFIPALFEGQMTPLMTLCLVAAWRAQQRGAHAAVGLLLIPLLLKPNLIYLAPMMLVWVALRRRAWATFASAAGMAALLLLAAFLFDPGWLPKWLTQNMPEEWQTVSLWHVLRVAFALPTWVQFAGVPLGAAVVMARHYRTERVSAALLGETTLLSVLTSPFLWHHDLIVILPAMLWLAAQLWRWGLGWLLLLLVPLALWLLPVGYSGIGMLPYLLGIALLWLWASHRAARPELPAVPPPHPAT